MIKYYFQVVNIASESLPLDISGLEWIKTDLHRIIFVFLNQRAFDNRSVHNWAIECCAIRRTLKHLLNYNNKFKTTRKVKVVDEYFSLPPHSIPLQSNHQHFSSFAQVATTNSYPFFPENVLLYLFLALDHADSKTTIDNTRVALQRLISMYNTRVLYVHPVAACRKLKFAWSTRLQ